MAWEVCWTAAWNRKLLLIAASAAWCAMLALAAHALDLNQLPLPIAAGWIFYLRGNPKIREQIACLILSVAFGLLVRLHTKDWLSVGSYVLALLGLGAFAMFGLQWIWSAKLARRQTIAMLAPASALVFFVFSAQYALNFTHVFHPKTYDLYLYAADGAFGFQPSFFFGRAMAVSHTLRIACVLAYLLLPLVMAFVYAVCLPSQAERPSWDFISLLMLAGAGGWALYNLVPATGPIYVFGRSFPYQPLPYHLLAKLVVEKIPVPGSAPRNAIPSLHLAWALLLYWNTEGRSGALRGFLAIYLALTVVSTLGTGEHYFVDLLAAVPFALSVQAALSPGGRAALSRRIIAANCGLGLTLGWLLLVRYGIKLMLISPAVPWGLAGLSCAVVWRIQSWFPYPLAYQPKRTRYDQELPLATGV